MPPKVSVPACGVKSCRHYRSINYRQRCALGRNNRNKENSYHGPCSLYEPKERAKRLPTWYGKN